MPNDIIIIPDVHGRTFWREAVSRYPDADIIFLGDYLDPYPAEEITPESAINNFKDIIEYAKSHANCQLLMGNHDLHYICNFGEACRLDYANSANIHFMLMDNLWLFKLMVFHNIANKIVVFTHAPILTEWIKIVGETDHIQLLTNRLNTLLTKIATQPWEVEDYLGHISPFRGGYDTVGSPVWADVHEVKNNLLLSADYSIFGHTQQVSSPIITDTWACLDCRRAFLLNSDFEIIPV